MMVDAGTLLTALLGAVASAVSTVGGVAVERRRARREERAAETEGDRLALDARDHHLDRLEREIARLDSALGDTREEREECLRMHRRCLDEASRMASRIAQLEDRLDAVEQRSGDSTPTSTERR